MRPELAVILSLMSLLVLGLNLGAGQTQGTGRADDTGVEFAQSLASARAALKEGPPAQPNSSPQAAQGERTRALFPSASIALVPQLEPEAQALPISKLLLRGIISVDSSPRAIFGVEDQSAPYRTVGAGDTIDAYTVETIGEDSVTLRSVNGQTEIFQLRGTGELPRY